MFRRFSLPIFAIVGFIYLVLIYYSFLISFAIDEGSEVTGFQHLIAPIFLVLRYPAWLFWPAGGIGLYLAFALSINIACCGYLVERIIYFVFRRNQSPKVNHK
jgi:hypothetical protein